MAGSYWRRGEGGENRRRMPGLLLLHGGSDTWGWLPEHQQEVGKEHTEHSLDLWLSRVPERTKLRLLP